MNFYSPDYFTARQRLRDRAAHFGWVHEPHSIPARGPNGEELTIDVFAPPQSDPRRTLIVSSGVHGVEGAFGSAVQLALLEQWGSTPPTRVVFLHAINPYGFAHRRRFNEENVDLNRNFILKGEDYSGSPPGYDEFHDLLNPRTPPGGFDPFRVQAMLAILRHGMPKLKTAIATGQYDFPRGLFFGGAAPAESVRILDANWERWLGRSQEVFHLDFHTGLGKRGSGKLLLDAPTTPEEERELIRRFGKGNFELCHSEGVAYVARGGFGPWCAERANGRKYLFACAEFGTYEPFDMIAALRAENRAHWYAPPGDLRTLRAKAVLQERFVPKDPDWRRKVLAKAVAWCEAATTG